MAGPTPAPSLRIHEAEATHHRARAPARDLLLAVSDEMRHTVGLDPDLGPYLAPQHESTGPAPTRAARPAARSLDQPPFHAEGWPRLVGGAVATQDLLLDRHLHLVRIQLLRTQDGILQHLHRLRLGVSVTNLFLDLLRALLLDGVMAPGAEFTHGLLLAAVERMYHCQRFSSWIIFVYSHGNSLSNLVTW